MMATKPKAVIKAKPGPKSKRTPEVEERLLEALQKGCTRRAACAYAGISKTEFYEWIAESTDFADTVTRAEDQAEAGFTIVLQRAAADEGDWRAAESWLKRRRREEWGDNVNIDIDRQISDLLEKLGLSSQEETTPAP